MKLDKYPDLEFIDVEQGSPEWFAARFGSVGGSEFKTAVAKGRGGAKSKTRTDLLTKKAIEQHKGEPSAHNVQTRAMRLGTELEPVARNLIRSLTGLTCATTGLVRNRLHEGFHLSPDGIDFNKIGIVADEIKCPSAKVHAGYIEEAAAPEWMRPVAYRHQINHYFVILNAELVVFFSYCPKDRALDELPNTPGFEWFNEDSEWVEFILRFIPRPDPNELAAHIKGMNAWRIDYAVMLLQAEKLVSYQLAELERKESKFTNAALRVGKLNSNLIEVIS